MTYYTRQTRLQRLGRMISRLWDKANDKLDYNLRNALRAMGFSVDN